MLALISPAKTLDFTTPPAIKKFTQPEFLGESKRLVAVLKKFSAAELAERMEISDRLADEVRAYYRAWRPPFTLDNAKQALLAFQGDVYLGLAAGDFSAGDFAFAQDHLRILSGLYGLLRPLDLMQPYRLEMGRQVTTPRGDTLYAFWGDRITSAVNAALGKAPRVLVNLASDEYFRALQPKQLDARLITPSFLEEKDGKFRSLSFFAKKARGLMTRHLIKNRLADPEGLKTFEAEGYRYNAARSKGDHWVFTRQQPPPVNARKS